MAAVMNPSWQSATTAQPGLTPVAYNAQQWLTQPGASQSGLTYGRNAVRGLTSPDGRPAQAIIDAQELHFGQPRVNYDQDVNALSRRINQVLPDAWYDKESNMRVEELLIQSVMQNQSRLLEWLPLGRNPHGIAFRFRRVHFHLHLPDNIPEQGVARVLTQSYEEWSGAMERWGIAFQMEDGFRMTPQGTQDYNCSIISISNSFMTLAYLEILMCLLNEGMPFTDTYNVNGRSYPDHALRQLKKRELTLFAIVHKDKDASSTLDRYITEAFSTRQVSPNGLIYSHGTKALFKYDKANFNYQEKGPLANQYREGNPNTFDRDMGKYDQFQAGLYPYGADSSWKDPTTRPRCYIEWHETKHGFVPSGDGYDSSLAGFTIVDMHAEQMAYIAAENMLKFCPLFDADGDLNASEEVMKFFTSTATLSPSLRRGWESYYRPDDYPLAGAAAADPAAPPPPRSDQIVTFGDYLRANGMYELVCNATSAALNPLAGQVRNHRAEAGATRGRFETLFVPPGQSAATRISRSNRRGLTGAAHQPFGMGPMDEVRTRVMEVTTKLRLVAYETNAGAQLLNPELAAFCDWLFGIANTRASDVTDALLEGVAGAVPLANFVTWANLNPDHEGTLLAKELVALLPMMFSDTTHAKYRYVMAVKGALYDGSDHKSVQYSPAEVGGLFATFPIENLTRQCFEWFLHNHVPLPLDFVCVRFMVDEMGTAVAGKKGSDTGRLFVGDPNFQMNHIGQTKMLYGYAHMYLGAMIYRPENVLLLDNIRSLQHINGGGVEFFDPNNSDMVSAYKLGTRDADIFVIPKLPGEFFPPDFDLMGIPRGLASETGGHFGYAARDVMETAWGWASMGSEQYYSNKYFLSAGTPTYAYRGPTYYGAKQNGQTNYMARFRRGAGHFPLSYNGCWNDHVGQGDNGLQMELPKNVPVIEEPEIVAA